MRTNSDNIVEIRVAIIVVTIAFLFAMVWIWVHQTSEVEVLEQSNPVQYQTDHTLPVEITTRRALRSDDEAQYHSALARSLIIDQSCYDTITELWFVHSIKDENGTWPIGWYVEPHDNIETLTLGNGTLALTDTDSIFNQEIDPDVTGLSCQNHTPHK